VPFGRGTYASRSAMLGGNALKLAVDAVIEKCKAFASFVLEEGPCDITFENRFQLQGPTAGSRTSRWRKPLTARPAYSVDVRSLVERGAGEDESARRQGNGRAGCMGAPPAVINAVRSTCSARSGVAGLDMPATPQRVWNAINTVTERREPGGHAPL